MEKLWKDDGRNPQYTIASLPDLLLCIDGASWAGQMIAEMTVIQIREGSC
jgi:hypothetical protein